MCSNFDDKLALEGADRPIGPDQRLQHRQQFFGRAVTWLDHLELQLFCGNTRPSAKMSSNVSECRRLDINPPPVLTPANRIRLSGTRIFYSNQLVKGEYFFKRKQEKSSRQSRSGAVCKALDASRADCEYALIGTLTGAWVAESNFTASAPPSPRSSSPRCRPAPRRTVRSKRPCPRGVVPSRP